MSAETPVCQLLERQDADYRGWWWVAPPRDGWLEGGEGCLVSADLAIREAWLARGRAALSPLDNFEAEVPGAVLFWPKAHALGEWWLLWLCANLPEGTPLQLVGEHQGGIKRVLKVLAALGLGCRKLDSARRCSLFETRTARLPLEPEAVWTQFEAEGLTLASHPGVFGHGKLDDGTRLLLEQLPGHLPEGEVLDLGCGDGIIGAWMAREGRTVTATDVNTFAVEASRRSFLANQLTAEALESDVYSALDGRRFSAIVSNPPFHQERSIDYGPAARLIEQAPQHLLPGGRLLIVANAFLPYADPLERSFGSFRVLADDGRFKVYLAER
ncbi:ribosomal RNA small subunit methyltransferase C [Halomonas cupida]|uniref:16S rRNA (Guanine1207-N2)-methyltransferase n=1 Tax=Halomonas cupida TaxID=44933 RepID=A0A1M7ERQ5_9GAMM|nr:class I SAM-dependent methyltransferase [Halomonas cupida]GEN23227.1 ribosomal RNA small subunit methyltransferase C [Halomonas cupida]SHL94308.1 16S rRNA (guanine1207-N2)-methyltransferase [Halomonas cupida]